MTTLGKCIRPRLVVHQFGMRFQLIISSLSIVWLQTSKGNYDMFANERQYTELCIMRYYAEMLDLLGCCHAT